MTTDLKSMTVEEAFGEWEGTEETYRWNMVRAAACHGTPDDSYPFQSGWKAAETEYRRRLEVLQGHFNEVDSALRISEDEVLRLRNSLEEAQQAHDSVIEEWKAAKHEIEKLQVEAEEAQQKWNDAQTQINRLVRKNAAHAAELVELERKRPFMLLRPRMFPDGNMWCALYGENIQDGVCAFGETPAKAATQFDIEWLNAKAGRKE